MTHLSSISGSIRRLAEVIEELVTDKAHVPSTSVNALSALIHDQWCEWSRNIALRENLSGERLERWDKLWVPYERLSDEEKAKDQEYSLKFLNGIKDNVLKDVFRGYLASVPEDWGYILPTDLHKMLESGEIKNYTLVDLRKPKDFAEGHIPGAINVFWLDFMRVLSDCEMEKLPKDKRIILICYLGFTASQTAVFLKLLGYNVKVLKFGMGKSPIKGIPKKGWLDFNFEISS